MSDKKSESSGSVEKKKKKNKANDDELLSIEESLRMCEEVYEGLMSSSDLTHALKQLEPYVERSIYHSASKCGYLILISVCTFDQDDIENASQAVDQLTKLCNKFRDRGFIRNIIKMIKTPNYEKYTDLQAHAELVHSISIVMSTLICALNTFNVYGLIKIAYRLQRFLRHFNHCKAILHVKTEWDSDVSHQNYEGLKRFANGIAHLAITQIPPKLLKIVNFLGYGGSEVKGWAEINKAAFELPGMTSRMARLMLIGYWTYVEPHGMIGPQHLEELNNVLGGELAKYPSSIILRGFKAKEEQLHGRIDNAIAIYLGLLEERGRISYDPFNAELMFCYALKSDWTECVKYAEYVRARDKHTPACATYTEAIFKYVLSEHNADPKLKQEASELFELVPQIRIRHFGKTMTPEKVAVVNSEKYFKNNEFLILPEVEFLYQYNYLLFIKDESILLDKFMKRVDSQVERFKADIVKSDYLDNYLTALFYKGFIHKLKGQYSEAIDCFTQVLNDESRIGCEFSIPPKTVLEMGLTYMEANDWDLANKYLNKSIEDYSGYLYENYVHLRAYGGLRAMGVLQDKQSADETKMKKFKEEWLKEIDVKEDNYEIIVQTEEKIASTYLDKK